MIITNIRRSGILLHPTSLPNSQGIGTFGKEAFRFIDWLESAGLTIWQVLPLTPTGFGESPYSSYSAFAGNPLLIDLDQLIQKDYLTSLDCSIPDNVHDDNFVNFELLKKWKLPLLNLAANEFLKKLNTAEKKEYELFKRKNKFWLDDFAIYMCKKENNKSDKIKIEKYKVIQYFFFEQWIKLKSYANEKNILIIGDLPIFVASDSVDVETHPELFQLKNGKPTVVAGVPPDYFSETGQLWGNPLYNWKTMEEDNYDWWIQRIKHSLTMYDMIRIDHFRGFESYWAVPAKEKTAVKGKWIAGPGKKLFDAIEQKLGKLPIIAEDLGVITEKVTALRDACGFPGMKVLQFAFSDAKNAFLPHNFTTTNSVIYTGTHDNDTTQGWVDSLNDKQLSFLHNYLGECMGIHIPHTHLCAALLRLCLASIANTAIFPLQDVYALGTETKMNTPGTCGGTNWAWRMKKEMLDSTLARQKAQWLKNMNALYARN